ncbi:4Fe-4S binding protein [Mycetohabitans sp. B5]|uniref:4Fe-4S binding protein n=1 Tax=Mycetohabitans endofungorum TaxID=417203 RepID=A0A2P5K7Q4_9BURK|nr:MULTISPECIES: 4Fe-4S binding protein [Mycetohabitans]MCG1054333.1 4Fe-4S binding protein [Mycetohabitans sp. B5]PPB82747.1 4Fe-4S binding protein [Mycetohabitans endofungorum]
MSVMLAPRSGWLAEAGHWMQRHHTVIRNVQWVVVLIYALLILVPAFMPLPDDTAHIWSNLTVFAQFVFWGIWWPFVLLSMVMLGRVWCGVLCPEGTLSEFASKHGLGRPIPRWIRWGGWPFVAFGLTTIYGQMVSVYQYPKAVLLVLGGSTVAAIAIGLLYGREKRVWCKYLCPVNGVFALLARLAPLRYRVDEQAWRRSYTQGEHGHRVIPVNCAPLVPLRNMKGASACHMCGRCSGHRDAIALTWRSPAQEVVELGEEGANRWDTALILYGLLGIAIGAFHWTVSPLFVSIKQALAAWLIDHDIMWPLQTNAPWFIFTHYPEQNDAFSWLDGGLVIGYIVTTGLLYGTALLACVAIGNLLLGRWRTSRLHHFAQALIPLAGMGVFLGLSATTVSLLRAEHLPLGWVPDVRLALLAMANTASLYLAVKIVVKHVHGSSAGVARGVGALLCFVAALAVVDSAWWLMFWGWA